MQFLPAFPMPGRWLAVRLACSINVHAGRYPDVWSWDRPGRARGSRGG